MSPVDLAPLVKDYQSKWVALSEDQTKVLGVGESAQAAAQDAESKGEPDYTLFYVRPFDLLYCGFLSFVRV